MSLQSSTVLLNRLLSLKESSQFFLVLDSLAQSCRLFTEEFISRVPKDAEVIFLSFETVSPPRYATHFVDCLGVAVSEISHRVQTLLEKTTHSSIILIDSLNYISSCEMASFMSSLAHPSAMICGTFHTTIPEESQKHGYPSSLRLLQFMASSIFEISPLLREHDEERMVLQISRLNIPILNCNKPQYKVVLTNRRKSGRALVYSFTADSELHVFEPLKESETKQTAESELLKDLTTFNLTTSSHQKRAKEQVDLPFFEAQAAGEAGAMGGAIVYEFEKDDDYDEEDPYEDPF